MMKKIKIAIFGGDKRQEYLAQMLSKKFDTTSFYVVDNDTNFGDLHSKTNFDVYILPIPVTKDGVHINTKFEDKQHKLDEIIKNIPPKSIILGGNVTKDVEDMFLKKDLQIIDYFKNESLAILNAVPIVFIKNQNLTYDKRKLLILYRKYRSHKQRNQVHL